MEIPAKFLWVGRPSDILREVNGPSGKFSVGDEVRCCGCGKDIRSIDSTVMVNHRAEWWAFCLRCACDLCDKLANWPPVKSLREPVI